MTESRSRWGKIGVAASSGLLVGVTAAATHLSTMPLERSIVLHVVVGDFVAALAAVIVCLAIQLRQEEIHYRTSIERAALVAELNHHIRNAIFPLCLAVHVGGDAKAKDTAQESVEKINIALKDATVDALSGRVQYRNRESSAEALK